MKELFLISSFNSFRLGRSTFRNADQTLREGVEFSWNKQLWRDLIATASYAYLDAKFDSNTAAIYDKNGKVVAKAIDKDAYIPGIAKNQAYLALSWKPQTGFYGGYYCIHFFDA